jgi:hypothetical protein
MAAKSIRNDSISTQNYPHLHGKTIGFSKTPLIYRYISIAQRHSLRKEWKFRPIYGKYKGKKIQL